MLFLHLISKNEVSKYNFDTEMEFTMNDIGYDLILNKAIKRKVKILSVVQESLYPISLKKISKICNFSLKTIQNDIKNILEDMPNLIRLVNDNDTISIEQSSYNDEITNHINEVIKDNPLFHIIESNFYGIKKDAVHYADELYISESSLKTYLQTLKTVLNEYNLSLSYSPVTIYGPEINMRYFYFQYFRYAHKETAPVVKNEHYYLVSNTIKQMRNEFGSVLNIDYYRMLSWLFIFEERIKQKCFLKISNAVKENFMHKHSYLNFKMVVFDYFKDIGLSDFLTEDELFFAYITRLDTLIYEDDKPFISDDLFEFFNNFEKMVLAFLIQSKLPVSLNFKLKDTLQAYLTNVTVLSQLSPFFQKHPSRLKNIVEKKHPEVLKIWLNILNNESKFEYPYDMALNLTLLSVTKLFSRKKILFMLTGEPVSITYYKNLALNCVPKNMEVTFLFNTPLTDDLLEQTEIDLCVYNFNTEQKLSSTKLFRLSDIPLESDWNKLSNILNHI